MKTLIAAALVACPSLAAAADLSLKLADGASWTQTIVNTRSDTRGGATQTMTATTVLRLTYHRKAAQPATLEEAFVSFKVDGVTAAQSDAVAAQAKVLFPVVLEVDDGLVPERVHDWPQMREQMFKSMEAMVEPKALAAVKTSFMAMDDKTAAALFKEQAMSALGQGGALELDKPQPYSATVPNPMGGPPIKTTGAFRLETFDAKAGRAVVIWTSTFDPQSAAASAKATAELLVRRVSPQDADKTRAQFASLTLERRDSCRYDIDLHTGLSAKADCTVATNVAVGGEAQKRTEAWLITQTVPEAR